jgi:hypothetical protein
MTAKERQLTRREVSTSLESDRILRARPSEDAVAELGLRPQGKPSRATRRFQEIWELIGCGL